MTCLLWVCGFIIIGLFYISTLYGIIGFFSLILLLYILLLRAKKSREAFKDKFNLPKKGLYETKIDLFYRKDSLLKSIHCWIFKDDIYLSFASPQIIKNNNKEIFGRLDIKIEDISFFIYQGDFLKIVEDSTILVPNEIYHQLLKCKSTENITRSDKEKVYKNCILVYKCDGFDTFMFFDYKIYNILEKLIKEKNYFYVSDDKVNTTRVFNTPLNKSYKKKE